MEVFDIGNSDLPCCDVICLLSDQYHDDGSLYREEQSCKTSAAAETSGKTSNNYCTLWDRLELCM